MSKPGTSLTLSLDGKTSLFCIMVSIVVIYENSASLIAVIHPQNESRRDCIIDTMQFVMIEATMK